MQLCQPAYPFRQSPSSEHTAVLVLKLNVVMRLGPVVTQKQHRLPFPSWNRFVQRKPAAP